MDMETYSADKINSNSIFGDNLRPNFGYRNYSRNNNEDYFEYDDDDESENSGGSITITMSTDNIEQLEHECDIKLVSLNTTLNQIINDHLNWHSNAPQTKMSYIPKSLVTRAVNQLTEEQLFEFAQSVVNDLRDMSLLLRGEFSLSSFLDILNIWLKTTRTLSRFEQDEHNYKIVIRHDMGYKYSYLIKEVFRRIIEEKFHKPFHYTMTETTILIRSESFIELVHKRPTWRGI